MEKAGTGLGHPFQDPGVPSPQAGLARGQTEARTHTQYLLGGAGPQSYRGPTGLSLAEALAQNIFAAATKLAIQSDGTHNALRRDLRQFC